jgi:Macrocin-O-methyltransferase (TylF)
VIWARELTASVNEIFAKLARRYIEKCMEIVLRGTDLVPAVRAAITSSDFESEHLRNAAIYKSKRDLFAACLEESKRVAGGLNMEFGVYKGDSINTLAKLAPERQFLGFDSFEGLPEMWTIESKKGAFDVRGKLPQVRKNVSLIKGFYSDTLPKFNLENHTEAVAFINVDCDLYSATKEIFTYLGDRFRAGTVIVFDEFFNYPDWLWHEYKAWSEFVEERGVKFTYIGFIRIGTQVAVRIDEIKAE